MRLFFFIIFLFLISINTFSQIDISKDDFKLPVNIKYRISSNFGEIRSNHFHGGLDIYTFVKDGISYYSVADGYISRIKVSPRGLGNAIYITHPNGYVSVYAHMSEFRFDIANYIYKLQHATQSFYQDVYLSPKLFPLKVGDYIGKSGNTGNSFGAHLHFELREEVSETPINPLYIFPVKDKVIPEIRGVYMYRFNNEINKSYISSRLLKRVSEKTIKSFGKIGFAIETHDRITDSHNIYGVYKVEYFVDDSLCFSYKMDKVSFDHTRYLNSFIDYERYKTERKKITKCFIEPNNKLPIYQTKGNGIYDFSDGKLHKVKIVSTDFNGNINKISFKILSDSTKKIHESKKEQHIVKQIDCLRENNFESNSCSVFFPLNSLYYNIDLQYYATTNTRFSKYSKLHHLHNYNIPIHARITIKIKPDSIAPNLKSKALICGLSRKARVYALSSKWSGDSLMAKVRNFGTYFVGIDSIQPQIKVLSIDKYNNVKSGVLKFKITDNLSGMEEYIAYIDNKWVLFEYDQKNNLISCNLKREKISKGEHELVLWVKDYCGNIADLKLKFKYK